MNKINLRGIKMKKIAALLFITCLYFSVATKAVEAQSIKGRAWQSQDNSSITTKPKTIAVNSDDTFYQIDFFYLNANTIYPVQTKRIEGRLKQIGNNLTFTSIVDGKSSKELYYKLNWKNADEFVLVDGNKTYSFAALGSNADVFSKNFIIPYLVKAISKSENYDFCYKTLTSNLAIDTVKLKEEFKIRSEASEQKKVSTEKFFRIPDGKTFTHHLTNGIIVFDFKPNNTYNFKYSVSESNDCTSGFEETGNYSSNESTIHFTRKTLIETECGVRRTSNGNTEYEKSVEWINDFNFRMKLGNLTYLFNAN